MLIERSPSVSHQAAELLSERILSGFYPPGSRLPSENELSKELGISRGSLREALNELETLQAITRKQGVGTFVTDRKALLRTRLESFRDIRELLEIMGHTVSLQASEPVIRKASVDESDHLDIQAGAKVLELTRLYEADGQAVMRCRYAIPVKLLRIQPEEIDLQSSFPDLLLSLLDAIVSSIRTRVRAVICPDDLVKPFGLTSGTPTVVIQDVLHDRSGKPIVRSYIDFNDKVIDFFAFQFVE